MIRLCLPDVDDALGEPACMEAAHEGVRTSLEWALDLARGRVIVCAELADNRDEPGTR